MIDESIRRKENENLFFYTGGRLSDKRPLFKFSHEEWLQVDVGAHKSPMNGPLENPPLKPRLHRIAKGFITEKK